MSKLAIFGGTPAVTRPKPHYHWPIITKNEIAAVREYLESGEPISIYGREGIYAEFENKFAKYHDVSFALTTNTGTSSLHSAYFGIGLSPGDEVICPTNTFLATVMPLVQLGVIPILSDCEEDTGNISPEDIKRKVGAKTKAIVVTHLWGHPVEIDEIVKIAKNNNLRLIEDCSHAHGATYKGKLVGTFGDAACFSLQGKKAITAGEGGIMITNDREVYERATLLGHFRVRSEQEVKSEKYSDFSDTGYGLNYRAHPLGIVIASLQLERLDEIILARNKCLNYLTQKLAKLKGILPPPTRTQVTRGGFYGYKIKHLPEVTGISKERFISAIQAEGVDAHPLGSKPLHLTKFFQTNDDWLHKSNCRCPLCQKKKTYQVGDLPISENYWNTRISLPTFTYADELILDQYVEAFEKVIDNIEELREDE